jgi:ribosomal protein S18 acetylase RimI-like enzyme
MVSIRKASLADVETIARFQEAMALETENLRLDPATIRAGIQAILQDPAKGQYFLATDEAGVSGSLLITYEWSDWRNSTVFWIQSVYVKPENRRKGIYKMLYRHVKELAMRSANVAGIRLYVDRTNSTAQKTYASLGMNGEHYQVFEWMKP